MELEWLICDAEFSHKAKQGNIQVLTHDKQLLSEYRK